jgi:hypothetical protein
MTYRLRIDIDSGDFPGIRTQHACPNTTADFEDFRAEATRASVEIRRCNVSLVKFSQQRDAFKMPEVSIVTGAVLFHAALFARGDLSLCT